MKTNPQPAPQDARREMRGLSHRTVGSRQQLKPLEHSGQHRQPKTGGTGGHGKKREG